jgi:tripartite-type tricarboxylate transporter receptor subunit TctC
MKRRQIFLYLPLAAFVLLTTTPSIRAQDYPIRPIKIIVPFPAGALTDSMARLVAAKLQEKWGQAVVVENRAGASGTVGTEAVSRAVPDGYTLLFTPQQPLVLSKSINPAMSFDASTIAPIAIVTRSTVLLLASSKLRVGSMQELIAYASSNPGKLNFASTGIGSTAHLSNELFMHLAQINAVNVPYQGVAPANTALLSGEVDLLFDSAGNALPNVRAGKVKILAIGSEKRSSFFPDVPTVAEKLPGFGSYLWSGLAAPPNTPRVIVEKLSAAISELLKQPDVVARFTSLPGVEAVGSSPNEMRQAIASEREQWAKLIRATGIKVE